MECGYQLFIIVLDSLFLKLILANYAPLNYNSTEDKDFFFSIPCSVLDILRFQILSIVFQLLSCVLLFPPHRLQHTGLPCPSPSPRVCWNSGTLSQWCSLTMLSITILFAFCLQSFPASGFFPINQMFASDGQSIGASASTSVLPMNIQDWFPLGLTGLISLQSKTVKSLLQHHSSKVLILRHSAFFMVQLSHHGKTIALTRWTFVVKVMSLCNVSFNMLSRFVIGEGDGTPL